MSKHQTTQGNGNTRKEGLGFDGQVNNRLKIKNLTKEKLTTKKVDEEIEPEKVGKIEAEVGKAKGKKDDKVKSEVVVVRSEEE